LPIEARPFNRGGFEIVELLSLSADGCEFALRPGTRIDSMAPGELAEVMIPGADEQAIPAVIRWVDRGKRIRVGCEMIEQINIDRLIELIRQPSVKKPRDIRPAVRR
jgi:hypothetical protein